MITWKEKIVFLGMTITILPRSITGIDACYRYKIRLYHNPGRYSHGHGDTLEKAIEDAATSFSICWSSVEQKITEREWQRISHL